MSRMDKGKGRESRYVEEEEARQSEDNQSGDGDRDSRIELEQVRRSENQVNHYDIFHQLVALASNNGQLQYGKSFLLSLLPNPC